MLPKTVLVYARNCRKNTPVPMVPVFYDQTESVFWFHMKYCQHKDIVTIRIPSIKIRRPRSCYCYNGNLHTRRGHLYIKEGPDCAAHIGSKRKTILISLISIISLEKGSIWAFSLSPFQQWCIYYASVTTRRTCYGSCVSGAAAKLRLKFCVSCGWLGSKMILQPPYRQRTSLAAAVPQTHRLARRKSHSEGTFNVLTPCLRGTFNVRSSCHRPRVRTAVCVSVPQWHGAAPPTYVAGTVWASGKCNFNASRDGLGRNQPRFLHQLDKTCWTASLAALLFY